MFEFLLNLFDSSDFPRRWECGTWTARHGWLHILSDIATWAAYTAIPVVLTYFVWRRKDIPFTRLFWLFAIFILACGSVHLVEAIIFWTPVYRVSGLLKLTTAIASWMTVVALVKITPQALRLPGLAATNELLNQEIGRRAAVEKALRDSEQRASLILESSGEAIYGVDLNGICTFCNPACVKTIGYQSADELIGRNMHELIHHTRLDGTPYPNEECHIYVAFRNNEEVHIDDELLWKKDGTSFPAEYWSLPIRTNGKIIGAVVTFNDITARHRARDELIRARQAAEEANTAKSQFLANTSHEIRTPLTAILGYAEILLEDAKDGAQRGHIETIQRNGKTLLDLIDDILDLSRIEAGRFECALSEFRVSEITQNVAKLVQIRADEKALPLNVAVENEVPEVIHSDEKRLRQVLVNLLANAIKFTEKGSVDLVVRSQREAGTPSLQFIVRDTGIGMTQEQRARLFLPFEQGDASVNRKYGGSGLGLAISKRLVEALGGELIVKSQEGVGSEFCVSIPLGIVESVNTSGVSKTDQSNEAESNSSDITLNCRVLLVDDRRDVRHLAQHFLTSVGAEVTTAEDGAQAIEAVRDSNVDCPFDIIVMDMQMPNTDGYTAVAQLRADGETMPIIALTADAMRGDRERALSIGCDEHLPKPIDSGKLIAIVNRLVATPREELIATRVGGGAEN